VLRFDYSGTGDSWGDLSDASIDQWVADVGAAVREMEMSGATEISLVGLRLGATLAALSACEQQSVRKVVLWEPVLDGARYVATLRALHDSWLSEERGNGRGASCTSDDTFSDRWTASLRDELAGLNLWSIAKVPASVGLLWQSDTPEHERFAAVLRTRGASVSTSCVEGATIWSRTPLMPDAAVPNKVLQSIVTTVMAEPC
jgi:pimeloyl-ACP methyl ester carboxylesterase